MNHYNKSETRASKCDVRRFSIKTPLRTLIWFVNERFSSITADGREKCAERPGGASVSFCTESSAVTHVSHKWEDHKRSCRAGLSEHFVTTNKGCVSFVLSSKKAKHVRGKLFSAEKTELRAGSLSSTSY